MTHLPTTNGGLVIATGIFIYVNRCTYMEAHTKVIHNLLHMDYHTKLTVLWGKPDLAVAFHARPLYEI